MDGIHAKNLVEKKCCEAKESASSEEIPAPEESSVSVFAPTQDQPSSSCGKVIGAPAAKCCGPKIQSPAPCCGASSTKAVSRGGWALASGALGFLTLTLAAWAVIHKMGWASSPTDDIMRLVGEGSRIFGFVGRAAWRLLPYFILSIALAGLLKVSGLTDRLNRAFEQRQSQAIVLSSLLGALTPFCSCGVIPIIASMLVAGVPLAPVMSFWISSPLMNPQVFFITMGTLGSSMALARLISALIMGLAAGFVTLVFDRMGYLQNQLRPGIANGCGCSENPTAPVSDQRETTPSPSNWYNFIAESGKIAVFLGKWLLIAFVLEALIAFYVPTHWISGLVGSQNHFSVLIATLVGIPAYMNSLAAIPVVQGLVQNGMEQGAALAFFTAGAVTTVPAMVAVLALVRRATFMVYLSISFLGALAAGTLYNLFNIL